MHPNSRPRPTVPDVMPLVRTLYERHAAGCCLHNVLDDGNLGDSSVDFCVEYAREQGCEECLMIGTMLRQMTYTQRAKLYSQHG